jgi:hypothetical protein
MPRALGSGSRASSAGSSTLGTACAVVGVAAGAWAGRVQGMQARRAAVRSERYMTSLVRRVDDL